MICEYMQVTPVLFGEGTIGMLGERIASMGCRKAMCVFDEGVKAAGISVKAVESLEKAGIDYIIFDRVVADPPDVLIDEAGGIARNAGVDCLIGVGGGSSMDTAKAVSILLKNPAPVSQYLNLEGPPFTVESGVPTILVPTSAGTGSEVTKMCVITHTEANVKIPIYTNSTLAIVDPELCCTAPAGITANGGLDALAHAIEAVTCVGWNPYSETLALAAVKRIARYLPDACRDGSDITARHELSLAASFAGIAFSATNVQAGHAAADSISASYHAPHGLACALVNAPVQELVAEAVPDKVKLVGEAMGVEFDGNESAQEIGKKTGRAIRELTKACGVKSMKELGFDRDVIVGGAGYVAASALVSNCPVEVSEEAAARILASAYDEYQ